MADEVEIPCAWRVYRPRVAGEPARRVAVDARGTVVAQGGKGLFPVHALEGKLKGHTAAAGGDAGRFPVAKAPGLVLVVAKAKKK